MRQKITLWLWVASILVISAVGAHYTRSWQGRSVPSPAGYVDFFGITFFLLSITIVTGVWKSRPYKPNDRVGYPIRRIMMFLLKSIFLLFVPLGLLAGWLRDWLFLEQRAMVYAVFALVSTAGFVMAKRLAATPGQDPQP
jgi:hypothetical protein